MAIKHQQPQQQRQPSLHLRLMTLKLQPWFLAWQQRPVLLLQLVPELELLPQLMPVPMLVLVPGLALALQPPLELRLVPMHLRLPGPVHQLEPEPGPAPQPELMLALTVRPEGPQPGLRQLELVSQQLALERQLFHRGRPRLRDLRHRANWFGAAECEGDHHERLRSQCSDGGRQQILPAVESWLRVARPKQNCSSCTGDPERARQILCSIF